jgi:tRNA threonylcarbamoyladenosine biosynthesis protein TsaB
MSLILALETSELFCSVALFDEEKVLHSIETKTHFAHSEMLLPFINQLIAESGVKRNELDAIAVSAGPGSYTGLRIGVSAAKGIHMGLQIPVIAVNTLEILYHAIVAQANQSIEPDSLIVPMIDARRMEVYTSVYDSVGNLILGNHPHILSENTVSELQFQGKQLHIGGTGAAKTYDFLKNSYPKMTFHDHCHPEAQHMFKPTIQSWQKKKFADSVNFEPNYLKAFRFVGSK